MLVLSMEGLGGKNCRIFTNLVGLADEIRGSSGLQKAAEGRRALLEPKRRI